MLSRNALNGQTGSELLPTDCHPVLSSRTAELGTVRSSLAMGSPGNLAPLTSNVAHKPSRDLSTASMLLGSCEGYIVSSEYAGKRCSK
jgi:hypothetical protein